jgi:hypothetical protein
MTPRRTAIRRLLHVVLLATAPPFRGFDLRTLAEAKAPPTPRLPRRVGLPSASYVLLLCTPTYADETRQERNQSRLANPLIN